MARFELQLLKKFYRRDLDSKTRAIIFYKLKLDDTIALLSDLEIELPPEVSVGKIQSMIADENELLEEVNDKIDALPMELPEEDVEDKAEDDEDDDAPILLELDAPGPGFG